MTIVKTRRVPCVRNSSETIRSALLGDWSQILLPLRSRSAIPPMVILLWCGCPANTLTRRHTMPVADMSSDASFDDFDIVHASV
jgi:hypothetical protein